MATVASLVRCTESSTTKSTTPCPSSMRAPLTRPTSTPASFTASPLNTPEASENTADSWYWCWKNSRFPIFIARTAVNTADMATNASTLSRVTLENRAERAIYGTPGRSGDPVGVGTGSSGGDGGPGSWPPLHSGTFRRMSTGSAVQICFRVSSSELPPMKLVNAAAPLPSWSMNGFPDSRYT